MGQSRIEASQAAFRPKADVVPDVVLGLREHCLFTPVYPVPATEVVPLFVAVRVCPSLCSRSRKSI